jgi:hypothetical protein
VVRLCAALAWYDEPLPFLRRCVTSLRGVVDELVALDGAWQLFEGGAQSASDQEETIRRAAAEAGIVAHIHAPREVWASQVAKRARLMELAAERADWILVIDGDEYVTRADPIEIRRSLGETDYDCAFVGFCNLNRGESMPGTTPHSGLNRRLFRAGTTVRTVHSGYVYDGRSVVIEDALDLRHALALEHDNVNRGTARNQRARTYRALRDMTAAEKWVTL